MAGNDTNGRIDETFRDIYRDALAKRRRDFEAVEESLWNQQLRRIEEAENARSRDWAPDGRTDRRTDRQTDRRSIRRNLLEPLIGIAAMRF
jgi:hypothetical protein